MQIFFCTMQLYGIYWKYPFNVYALASMLNRGRKREPNTA